MTPTNILIAVGAGSVVAFAGVQAGVWGLARRWGGAGRPVPGRVRLFEAAWMATPAILLLGLLGWSARVLGGGVGIVGGEADLTVHVAARQFVWKIRHEIDTAEGRRAVETLNQLHLPVGKTARIVLESEDVLHGFWIPQLRVREEVPPGEVREFWIRPTEEGQFNIVCADACGVAHYAMRGFAHVQAEEAFRAWLDAERETQVSRR